MATLCFQNSTSALWALPRAVSSIPSADGFLPLRLSREAPILRSVPSWQESRTSERRRLGLREG
ncbi:hypothetical protein JRQ81_019376, partial [Phrynocephalus forsythii]